MALKATTPNSLVTGNNYLWRLFYKKYTYKAIHDGQLTPIDFVARELENDVGTA
jgi:hypothetical protein